MFKFHSHVMDSSSVKVVVMDFPTNHLGRLCLNITLFPCFQLGGKPKENYTYAYRKGSLGEMPSSGESTGYLLHSVFIMWILFP